MALKKYNIRMTVTVAASKGNCSNGHGVHVTNDPALSVYPVCTLAAVHLEMFLVLLVPCSLFLASCTTGQVLRGASSP